MRRKSQIATKVTIMTFCHNLEFLLAPRHRARRLARARLVLESVATRTAFLCPEEESTVRGAPHEAVSCL